MKIILDTYDLKKILDSKFGEESEYTIHYFEPEYIWRKRNDITV